MPKKVSRKVGSGITERTESWIEYDAQSRADGQALQDALMSMSDRFLTPWGENESILQYAQSRLEKIDEQVKDDPARRELLFKRYESEGWYLRNIVIHKKIAEAALDGGSVHEAVQAAMQIGVLATELKMKQRHEPDFISGKSMKGILALMRERENQIRKEVRQSVHKFWQTEADEIWSRKPYLSKIAIAKILKDKFSIIDSVNTIRQRIQKPDKAG